ncbi:hypothetical protein BCE02nite_00410 [Brevibacillus centrosporus]|nr:hypothetical protein BCE02nite_00410 [Brevibacillus centrosporus]
MCEEKVKEAKMGKWVKKLWGDQRLTCANQAGKKRDFVQAVAVVNKHECGKD